jgi:hypothetical protein
MTIREPQPLPVLVTDRQTCADSVATMLALAAQRVDIAARRLDPALFDREAVVESLRQLVTRQRRARVRLLVLQPEGLEKRGHRLLELAFRLSSYFEVRHPPAEEADFNEAMVLVDESSWLHQRQADRYDSGQYGEDITTLRHLRTRFDGLWTHSLALTEFRRLML